MKIAVCIARALIATLACVRIFPRQISTRHLKFLCAAVLAFAGLTNAVRGQSALDGFDPNANGYIGVVVVQPDGKILIGGGFTTLAPNGGPTVARNRIARLNPDGTLDTAFNPNANERIFSIALQPDGKILFGGAFTDVGGQTRSGIARVDATTGLVDSFDPNGGANTFVYSILVQADGKTLLGGGFTSIGGQTRGSIARLDPSTGLADSFNPNANNYVDSIALQADGKILVGGFFTSIGGEQRSQIARLDPTTGLADSFNPNASDAVFSIAVQADGKILAGGVFTSIGGQTRNYLARLDPVTGLADSFDPNASPNGFVRRIEVQPDGRILAGGDFTSIGGQTRKAVARLDATTGLADSFNANLDYSVNIVTSVYGMAVQGDGKILVGGTFDLAGGQSRKQIARLETDGQLDQTLNLNIVALDFGYVQAIAVQPDGKIVIGGRFESVLGQSRNSIARLNSDGTLDMAFHSDLGIGIYGIYSIAIQTDGKILVGGQVTNHFARLDPATGLRDSFNPNANNDVFTIAVQADGRILVGGAFTNIGGQVRNRVARLDPVTGLADSFDPNTSNEVYSFAIQADSKILAGGAFTSIGGQERNRLARLDAITGLADSFNPNANSHVYALAVQADGKILVGGYFNTDFSATTIGGQTRNYIARLDPATGLADSFDPNANSNVYSIAVQADGKILAGGSFTNIGGQTRRDIARLDATTGLADSFAGNSNGRVYGIAAQADGKILVGGEFTTVGGESRSRFARLSNDVAALQSLAVSQSTVTWTRDGSSPLFTRVTFESSTNNVNYTPLGNGTANGTSWTLIGLNMPTGQNIYVRARGYYGGGEFNGSGSITESVRNAFLPLAPSQVVSRKLHGDDALFDINLPLIGNSGIECRSGGASNNYQVVFTFPSAVTFTSASVSSGMGTVSSTGGSGTTVIMVNLTGVPNSQRIRVMLLGVNDGTSTADVGVPMGVLVGDTNGDGFVNSGDALQTRNRSGQTTDTTNFRSDVNTDGFVNSGDTLIIRSRSGTSLP